MGPKLLEQEEYGYPVIYFYFRPKPIMRMDTYNNPILGQLPLHLRQYIVPQHYQRYTPIDQATWRYIMRQNYSYLKDVAYYPYIPGLRKAGLSVERIPSLQEMNDSLKKIGWGAATVDGFIPPLAFMEFQANRILVIAADIRQPEHIEYTPAPDIIHESSGHAPIIAEPEYAAYLQYFGEIGSKAMFSARDFELYEAIRRLSILKENTTASANAIKQAEDELQEIQDNMGEPSEMALLSRLHWWTVEYGLIGTLDNPKIYGAGLLSSIGESVTCMKDDVPKLPYNIDTVQYSYDITKPQPQLFVTPNFEHLITVLEQFANSMSFRKGGKESVDKAIACRNVCTAVYSSGLQVSGVFVATDEDDLTYLSTAGPTALAYGNRQLGGHDKTYHRDGFSSPVGPLKRGLKPLEEFEDDELETLGVIPGQRTVLEFASGIQVDGVVTSITRKDGKLLLISFNSCHVTNSKTGKIHFQPEWGTYDMAVGEHIVSVYSGAADKDAFEQHVQVSRDATVQRHYSERQIRLHNLYIAIRTQREGESKPDKLKHLWYALRDDYPEDWLGVLELAEIATHHGETSLSSEIIRYLRQKQADTPKLSKLIEDGISLIGMPEVGILN